MLKHLLWGISFILFTTTATAFNDTVRIHVDESGSYYCESIERQCQIKQVQPIEFGDFKTMVTGEAVLQHIPIDIFDSGKETSSFLALCKNKTDQQPFCIELLKGRTNLYRFESVDINGDSSYEWALLGSTGFHSSFIEIFSPDVINGVKSVFTYVTNTPNLELQKDDKGYFVEFEQIDYQPDYETGARSFHRVRIATL